MNLSSLQGLSRLISEKHKAEGPGMATMDWQGEESALFDQCLPRGWTLRRDDERPAMPGAIRYILRSGRYGVEAHPIIVGVEDVRSEQMPLLGIAMSRARDYIVPRMVLRVAEEYASGLWWLSVADRSFAHRADSAILLLSDRRTVGRAMRDDGSVYGLESGELVCIERSIIDQRGWEERVRERMGDGIRALAGAWDARMESVIDEAMAEDIRIMRQRQTRLAMLGEGGRRIRLPNR